MRLLKKWYFKIYHLLKFLGIFLIMMTPNIVKAECNNLYDLENSNFYLNYNDRYNYGSLYYSTTGNSISYIMENQNTYNKTFTFFFEGNNQSITDYLTSYNINIIRINFKPNSTTYQADLTQNSYTFTNTYGGSNQISLEIYGNNKTSLQTLKTLIENGTIKPFIVEGTEKCSEPTPQPDNFTYDNFLTLYIDRIEYLGNGSVENPYMLTMIGIIFGFVVLEIFLRLFRIRGGYKK